MKNMQIMIPAAVSVALLVYLCTVVAQDTKSAVEKLTQPDYKRWKEVEKGMKKKEILKILGRPTKTQKPAGTGYLHDWEYGTVVQASAVFPEKYAFVLTFSNDELIAKADPFGSVLSRDGKPSHPKLIIPKGNQVFDHYPRIVDLRWYPCSGQYPMQYVVEFDTLNKPGGWVSQSLRAESPYLAVSFGGMTKGRWRVKGKNSKGEGPWSEYRYFEFTQ